MKAAKKDILTLLLLGIALSVFFWPETTGSKMFSLGGVFDSDFLLSAYPFRQAYKEALFHGHFPWWVQSIGSGYPLVAGGDVAAWYPVNIILFSIFPTHTALGWLYFIETWLAAIGVYLLTLRFTHLRASAILSSLAFALSGFMITQVDVGIFTSFSLFPLLFYFYLFMIDRFSLNRFIVFSVFLALMLLTGYYPTAYYSILMLFVTGMLKAGFFWKRQVHFGTILIAAIVVACCLCAIQIIPTVELMLQSHRNAGFGFWETVSLIYPLEGFLTFFRITGSTIPSISWKAYFVIKSFYSYYSYVGLIPLLLIPFGIWRVVKTRSLRFLMWLTLFSFFMMLGSATPIFGFVWNIVPGMKLFRHSIRFLGFFEFYIAILAGFGLAWILNKLSRFPKLATPLISLLVIGITLFDLFTQQQTILPTQSPSFWSEKPEVVKFLDGKLAEGRVASFSLSFFRDWRYINDWGLQRSFKNFLPADYNMIFHIPTVNIYTALDLERNTVLLANSYPVELLISDALALQLQNKGKQTSVEFPDQSYRLLQIMGIKYLISPIALAHSQMKLAKKFDLPKPIELTVYARLNDQADVQGFPLTIRSGYVYEVTDALPRAAFVSSAVRLDQHDTQLGQLLNRDFDPLKTILIEEGSVDKEKQGSGKVKIVSDEDEKTAVGVNAGDSGWLYLSDSYYPGWKAYVDSKETKIYRANYAFRAVQLPKGDHIVEFVYDPLSRKVGLAISLITSSILIFLLRSSIMRLKTR